MSWVGGDVWSWVGGDVLSWVSLSFYSVPQHLRLVCVPYRVNWLTTSLLELETVWVLHPAIIMGGGGGVILEKPDNALVDFSCGAPGLRAASLALSWASVCWF